MTSLQLSFVGNLKREEFAADLTKRVEENRSWQISTILAAYPIPERLNRKLLKLSGIPDDLKCNHFSAEQRSRLITNCTQFPLTVEAPGGFSVAMVTRGGVALDGVNLKTMESKSIPNLYFAGEVLDIDGDTGGYNLQAAFSTGFLAGQGIRKKRERVISGDFIVQIYGISGNRSATIFWVYFVQCHGLFPFLSPTIAHKEPLKDEFCFSSLRSEP